MYSVAYFIKSIYTRINQQSQHSRSLSFVLPWGCLLNPLWAILDPVSYFSNPQTKTNPSGDHLMVMGPFIIIYWPWYTIIYQCLNGFFFGLLTNQMLTTEYWSSFGIRFTSFGSAKMQERMWRYRRIGHAFLGWSHGRSAQTRSMW